MTEISVLALLGQLLVAVPTIIASTILITEAIKKIFTIETPWVNHLVSWVLSVAVALLFVLCGKLTFGLGNWDYLVGGVFGLVAGGASNGLYDWDAVRHLVELIIDLFSKPFTKSGK